MVLNGIVYLNDTRMTPMQRRSDCNLVVQFQEAIKFKLFRKEPVIVDTYSDIRTFIDEILELKNIPKFEKRLKSMANKNVVIFYHIKIQFDPER